MTFKEKLLEDYHNQNINVLISHSCPSSYGYENKGDCPVSYTGDVNCDACWDREIPEMKERDGCHKCKHNDKTESEYPCNKCRGTQTLEERKTSERPDYWEGEDDTMEDVPFITLPEKHKEICDKLNDIYRMKNTAYGNSFGDTFKKLGLISAVTRISDKYNRLCTLATKPEIDTFDESIKDTLLDMANYCIMTVMELER